MQKFLYDYKLSHRRNHLLVLLGGCKVIESKELMVSLDTENHSIGAEALTEGLAGFCALLQILRKSVTTAEGLDIEVEALEPGSFRIKLNLIGHIASLVGSLATAMGASPAVTALITATAEYYQIHELLAGSVADSVEEVDGRSIVTKDHSQINVNSTVFNVYRDSPEAADACTASSRAFHRDKRINGFFLASDKGKKLAEFDSPQLEKLSRTNGYMVAARRTIIEDAAVLTLRSPSLDCSGKWKCLYQGRKISVAIADEDFRERVLNRELRFANADQLTVRLQIAQLQEAVGKIWKDQSFKALQVYKMEHTPQPEQKNIF